jgi:hypothetical protein
VGRPAIRKAKPAELADMDSLTRIGNRALPPEYSAEIDTVDEERWCRALEQFDDANIYQTWSYDEVRCGRKNISHMLLKRNGNIVAAAQARVAKAPFITIGVAYVRWGPLWRRGDEEPDPEIFRLAVRALRNEYAFRRGLVLRLYPALFHETPSRFASILAEEGFSNLVKERAEKTIIIDMRRSLEDLRKGLRSHWYRYLKVAERNGLEIVEGSGHELFRPFVGIYKEMVARKKFMEPNDIMEFLAIQERLPQKYKMRVLLCKSGGDLCAGLVCSAIGKTAIYLFGATSDAGLKKRGSYLLHWRLIEWLKNEGITNYDLHGIDALKNPGTYKFKADLCGSNGREKCFLGRFDSYSNILGHLGIDCGDHLRRWYRRAEQRVISGLHGIRSFAEPAKGFRRNESERADQVSAG